MTNCVQTRRIGHANMFVKKGGLEAAVSFYRDFAGLQEVRREPEIAASLLSTGQTHHDVAVVEMADEDLLGADGSVQIAAGRGRRGGVNHFGWETRNEADLVRAHAFARQHGVKILKTVDHQIARSLYVFDPDGHLNEWYADIMFDWRTVLNPQETHLVTTKWEVGAEPPLEASLFHEDPQIVRLEEAIFHPRGLAHVTIVARHYDRMRAHYIDFAGLRDVHPAGPDICFLGGSLHKLDLVLARRAPGVAPGVSHLSFLVDSEAELEASIAKLDRSGRTIVKEVDAAHKRSVFVTDPDQMLLEFYVQRDGAFPSAAEAEISADLLHSL